MPTRKKSLYFHNGGFYAMPHFVGAINELLRKKRRNYNYYGNSAGASWALVCYLILNGHLSFELLNPELERVFSKRRPISSILTPIYCDLIDVMIPYWPADLAKRVSGVLHIGVSTRNGHQFVNQFDTNADLYNALLCSGTISLCSNYESAIDNEVCLDGGYTFLPEHLPENTLIIASGIRAPLSLTCPPSFICPFLEENGRKNVLNGLEQPMVLHELGQMGMEWMLYLHSLMEKDANWSKHIANMTR
jgi:hypothetical protein